MSLNNPWSSVYPGALDSTSNMPTLTNESTPGAGDGDVALVSHPNSLRDSLIQAETKISNLSSASINLYYPRMVWESTSQIAISNSLGNPLPVWMIFQDQKARKLTSSIRWDFSNGAGELGIDQGTEQSNKWYYLYSVPKASNDSEITFIASATSSFSGSTSGPFGYTNFRHIGAFYNDTGSNIKRFKQTRNDFYFSDYVAEYVASSPSADVSPVQQWLTGSVPETAGITYAWTRIRGGGNSRWQFNIYSDPTFTECAQTEAGSLGTTATDDTGSFIASFPIPMFNTQRIWRKLINAGGTNNVSQIILFIRGWKDEYLP